MPEAVTTSAIVDVRELSVAYGVQPPVIRNFSLSLGPGDRIGIAGESGCGKTTLLRALVGLLPADTITSGWMSLQGRAGYIPQESTVSLSPFLTVAEQVTEFTRSAEQTARWFARAGLSEERFLRAYPHELSGGERQRVLAIQALALKPSVIVADEPTANLDAGSEAAILSLLDEYARQTGAPLLIASHRERVFDALRCRVQWMTPQPRPMPLEARMAREPNCGGPADSRALLSVRGVSKSYSRKDWLRRTRPLVQALDRVSLEIGYGECVSLAGDSGAGKSTLARCIGGRERADSGSIEWHSAQPLPERVQLVSQEPSQSLNPQSTIADVLGEACGKADVDWLPRIRFPRDWIDRRVSALSEGQRARIAILRSTARLRNGLLILDESLSGLDNITRGHILAFISEMQQERALSVLLIAHDPEPAIELGARTVRMEAGRIAV